MVVCSWPCFVDLQQMAHFLKHLGLEVSSLITVYAVWHTISTHPVLYQHPCTSCGTLIGNCKCLSPLCKTALHSQNIPVSLWDHGKGPTMSMWILYIGFPVGIGCKGAFGLGLDLHLAHVRQLLQYRWTAFVSPGLQNLAFIFLKVFILPRWAPAGPSWTLVSTKRVLLLVALTVPTVPRFPLLLYSRVGVPRQSASSTPVTLGSLLVAVVICGSAGGTHEGYSPWSCLGSRDKLSALLCFFPGWCWIS